MSAEHDAWCLRCGEMLHRVHGTAYVRCAKTIYCGRDYWARVPPTPIDGPSVSIQMPDGRRYWAYTAP